MLRGRRLAIASALVALLIAFGVSLVVVPWPYRVDATGRLMPVVQREVFAPWDGQVVELLVQGGERVEAGQILLHLRSDELSAELLTVENQLHEKRKLYSSLIAQRDDTANRDEELKLQGKAVETKVEMEGAALQATVLKERLARLTVRAPIAGVVTTFQAQQLLLNRPVKRGDLLLQVMDETGDWQLELEVEVAEHRLGRILVAQQKLAASGRETRDESQEPKNGAKAESSSSSDPQPSTLNPRPALPTTPDRVPTAHTTRCQLPRQPDLTGHPHRDCRVTGERHRSAGGPRQNPPPRPSDRSRRPRPHRLRHLLPGRCPVRRPGRVRSEIPVVVTATRGWPR